jgi:hypothetical protein
MTKPIRKCPERGCEGHLWPTDNETIVKCDRCRSEWFNNKY